MMQFGLPLDWPVNAAEEAFIVTPANRRTVQFLDGWGRWPVAAALLTGPRKSGRSLLARIFAIKSGGTIADDAERYDEEWLFNRWNEAQEEHRPLLIVAEVPPPQWPIRLADLASRLAATPSVQLSNPDGPLTEALLEKLLKQRGLSVSVDVLHYLTARIERTHLAVVRIADALDAAALAQSRAITIPLAKQVLTTLTGNRREHNDGDS